MAKKRLLFVDDDVKVLQGLQRMLRPMQAEWQVEIAENAKAALERLAQETFDVVVSDLRMPEMDGAELLSVVMQRYPHIVRIILSGQSNQDMVLRTVGPTHQYLAKPCDAILLKETIQRIFELRVFLQDERLRQVIAKFEFLPSLPNLYVDIVNQLHASNPSIEGVGKIIARDIGMTAQILRLVNSAYFGYYSHVTSLNRAITILGLEKIGALVLSRHLFAQVDPSLLTLFNIYELWQHSLRVATCAQEIAVLEGGNGILGDEAFMAGLLHDAGRLILMTNFPDEYVLLLRQMVSSGKALCQAEADVFGATHAEIGAYLFGLWGMSHPLLEAIAYHHDPSRSSNRGLSSLAMVYIVNFLDHHQGSASPAELTWDHDYLQALHLENHEEKWIRILAKYSAST
jgi:HD-like signal output (HDOD) protein/ActR/RegA family two-component response regulator